jgi:uncharacterized membrane protein YgcG
MKVTPPRVVLLLLLALVGGAAHLAAKDATARLTSQWGTPDIQMGNTAVDSLPVVLFTKDSPFTIGLYNDRDFLYVLLRTSDAVMRARMLQEGFVVWFDPKGGTKKEFGIQYPSGQRGGGGRSGGYGGRPRGGNTDVEVMWEQAENNGALAALELLGPGKDDRLRLLVARTTDPKVRITSVEGTVTYQMKVLLATNGEDHHAIGTKPGSVIGVGLVTPDPLENSNRSTMRGGGGGGSGGRAGGGRGGRGGGRRGGYGGGQSRADFERPKPLKEWTTVKLATGADSADSNDR